MQEIELNLEKTLAIWWAFAWRAFLFSILAGIVLGFIGGFIVGIAGSPQLGGAIGGIMGFIGSIPVSIWSLQKALSKKYGKFSIVLVSRT